MLFFGHLFSQKDTQLKLIYKNVYFLNPHPLLFWKYEVLSSAAISLWLIKEIDSYQSFLVRLLWNE